MHECTTPLLVYTFSFGSHDNVYCVYKRIYIVAGLPTLPIAKVHGKCMLDIISGDVRITKGSAVGVIMVRGAHGRDSHTVRACA